MNLDSTTKVRINNNIFLAIRYSSYLASPECDPFALPGLYDSR